VEVNMSLLPMLLLLLSLIWPFGGGKNFPMTAAPTEPAASGTVNVSKGTNGNIRLDIKVRRLSKPDMLTPPAGAYIVWLKPANHKPVELGVIHVDQSLQGELTTTTPYKSAKVTITPAPNAAAASSDATPVLTGHYTAP
jgi:hypothetical protein